MLVVVSGSLISHSSPRGSQLATRAVYHCCWHLALLRASLAGTPSSSHARLKIGLLVSRARPPGGDRGGIRGLEGAAHRVPAVPAPPEPPTRKRRPFARFQTGYELARTV